MVYNAGKEDGSYKSKLQKRCLRILFDHHEFYYFCTCTKKYTEHMAQKDFNLEHAKLLLVKNNLLTIHNLYTV